MKMRNKFSSTLPLLLHLTFDNAIESGAVISPYGKPIVIPFPNQWDMLGVGGLTYDKNNDIWTCVTENIPGSPVSDDYPKTSVPRLFHMKLDFENGIVNIQDDAAVEISSANGLKLEDISLVPYPSSTSDMDFWVASEANSHLVKTNTFLSKDFGAPDLSTFDPLTFSVSRLIRVDGSSGLIKEEASVPSFAQWDLGYDWDALQCVGDRPFQGFHALSITPSVIANDEDELTGTSGAYTMIVGSQAAFYQDGQTPNEFDGSATRLMYYSIDPDNTDSSVSYSRSYRYDSSQLTIKSYQKGARHFNAIFGLVALNETSLIIAECEEFLGFGQNAHEVINRLFYFEIDPTLSVDHCSSLLECDVDAPMKRLLWERKNDDKQLDGISLGPPITISTGETLPSIALVYENDSQFGTYIELFVLDTEGLNTAPIWGKNVDIKEKELRQRIITVSSSAGVILLLVLVQFFLVRYLLKESNTNLVLDAIQDGSSPDINVSLASRQSFYDLSIKEKTNRVKASLDNSMRRMRRTIDNTVQNLEVFMAVQKKKKSRFKHLCLLICMLNSFLVGGLTFGFSGMSLMLRKEGIFAGQCGCGSFCSAEKQALALVSTVGFAVAIGSRLSIGLFLDVNGPKLTSVLCTTISFVGFLLLGLSSSEQLKSSFIWAWSLIALGGSGLHIVGFHMTNNYNGQSKQVASVCISAAFGASAAVFPIWQLFNQYAGLSIQHMASAYSVIIFVLGLINWLLQPWNKVQPGVPLKPNFQMWESAWWKRGPKRQKPIVLSTVLELMSRFEFWAECLFFSVNLFILTYYLSTNVAFLFEKGDIPFTSNPNDPSDYMYSRLAGWLNSLGFLWYPMTKYLILKTKWSTKFTCVMVINTLVALIIIAVPQLSPQIIAMVFLSFTRLMLFSFHHAFILDKFGIEYFGILNGISSFIAAIIGLLNYPLQLMAIDIGSFSITFVPIAIVVVLVGAFPFFLNKHPVFNWAETYSIDPRKIRYPRNREEVLDLIKNNDCIRCVGSMHSCAPLVESEGIIISFDKMNEIIEIDEENETVTVEPGVKIYQVCEALKPYNLGMGTLGTIDYQGCVGAVMTGTHGGSLTTPSLHDFVESYTLLKSNGELMTVRRSDDPKLFSAMAPCMGVFGVVIDCTFRLVKLQYLEAKMTSMPFADMIPKIKSVMQSNKYCRIIVYPSIDMATIWEANPVGKRGDAVARGALKSKGYINFRDEYEKAWLEEFLVQQKHKCYDKADRLLRQVMESQLKRLKHYEGAYNHVICKERNHGIPHADIEFAMDFNDTEKILTTVREWYLAERHRVPYYNFEIRTTKQDSAMMSCCYGRDTLFIDFQAKSTVSAEFFKEMEDLLTPFGYRKHWAKGMCHSNPGYIIQQFPNVADFIDLIGQFDPEGKFRNEHIDLWYKKIKEKLNMGINEMEGNVEAENSV